MAKELDNGNVLCHQCGNEYKRIGTHWSQGSTCDHPDINPYLKEIITGLMMGDGTLCRQSKNPHLAVKMISKNYLEYLDDIFGWLTSGVSLAYTAAEGAQKNRDSGFSPNADASDYSDMYRLTSRSHPQIEEFNWYGSGRKVWPDDIGLTPAVLMHWYVGDGHWDNSGSQNRIDIGVANEIEYIEKVSEIFTNVSLPVPKYKTYEYSSGHTNCIARWPVEESHELWEYMETPPPDFHYKFPKEYHSP